MTNPTILPTFFAKEPLFAVFFYTIAEIFCPVPCPTEAWCPIHRCAHPGVMPQPRDRDGIRSPMPPPTVKRKTQRTAMANAARCDDECNALHGHMHRTAFSGASVRGFDCSGPREEITSIANARGKASSAPSSPPAGMGHGRDWAEKSVCATSSDTFVQENENATKLGQASSMASSAPFAQENENGAEAGTSILPATACLHENAEGLRHVTCDTTLRYNI